MASLGLSETVFNAETSPFPRTPNHRIEGVLAHHGLDVEKPPPHPGTRPARSEGKKLSHSAHVDDEGSAFLKQYSSRQAIMMRSQKRKKVHVRNTSNESPSNDRSCLLWKNFNKKRSKSLQYVIISKTG
jgi:hypothetical protein